MQQIFLRGLARVSNEKDPAPAAGKLRRKITAFGTAAAALSDSASSGRGRSHKKNTRITGK